MFLREFVEALAEALRRMYEEYFSLDGPTARLLKQLRIMFGRGEIKRETFFLLRSRLDKGYYIEGELKNLHRQAVLRMGMEGRVDDLALNRSIARNLDTVYLNRAILEEVRSGMQHVLAVLEQQRQWCAHQAAEFRARAQASLPDEDAARDYLDIRHQLLEQGQLMETRLKMMQQELRRLERLEGQLRFYETELLVLHSREHLALEEFAVRRRLHS